jgi:hypothetical protein
MAGKSGWVVKGLIAVVFAGSLASTISFGSQTPDGAPAGATPSASPSMPSRETNVIVPDLRGKEIASAGRVIESLGLAAEVAIAGTIRQELWGVVLDQEPRAGSSTVPGGLLRLVVARPERPLLELPRLDPGERCPATSVLEAPGLRFALGGGPVQLGSATGDGVVRLRGTEVQNRAYRISSLWRPAQGYRGPILVRGDRIDGPGSVRFEQDPTPTEGGFEQMGTPNELHFPAGGSQAGPAFGAVTTYIGGPGCYAFQVDGDGFSETIVVRAER